MQIVYIPKIHLLYPMGIERTETAGLKPIPYILGSNTFPCPSYRLCYVGCIDAHTLLGVSRAPVKLPTDFKP